MLGGGHVKPRPIPRSPLVLPPGAFATTLPWAPPNSRDYLRADSWGVTMPGFPWVPGAAPDYYERVLSWFLDRYTLDQQKKYLNTVGGYGYTHLKLSAGDSMGPRDNGPNSPPGNAQTLGQLVATCRLVKQFLPYVQMTLGSKYFHPWNMSLDQYQSIFEPIMDALISARVVDEFIPGWEWDLWNQNTPGPITISIFKWVGQKAHAAGCSNWSHFSSEKTSWFADGDPRGRYGFWDDLGADMDGINYQTEPSWSIKDTQDRIVDTLKQFGQQGNVHKFRFDEDEAALEWNNPHPNEDDANARGYLAACTYDNVAHTDAKVWGFGNGARMPDGGQI